MNVHYPLNTCSFTGLTPQWSSWINIKIIYSFLFALKLIVWTRTGGLQILETSFFFWIIKKASNTNLIHKAKWATPQIGLLLSPSDPSSTLGSGKHLNKSISRNRGSAHIWGPGPALQFCYSDITWCHTFCQNLYKSYQKLFLQILWKKYH